MKPRFHESVSSAASQSSFCMHYCNFFFLLEVDIWTVFLKCFIHFHAEYRSSLFILIIFKTFYEIERPWNAMFFICHFFLSFSSKGRSPTEFTRHTIISLSLSYYWRFTIMNHKEKKP